MYFNQTEKNLIQEFIFKPKIFSPIIQRRIRNRIPIYAKHDECATEPPPPPLLLAPGVYLREIGGN